MPRTSHLLRTLLVPCLLFSFLASATLVANPQSSAARARTISHLKVAFLSDTPTNDGGWTETVYQDAQRVKAALGSKMQYTFVPSLSYTNAFTETADRLIGEGYNVLFDFAAAGSLFYSACSAHPGVICLENEGVPPFPSKNIGGFFLQGGAIYYLLGELAGYATKTGVIGFVAPFKIPLVNGELNAYTLGCQKIRPDCVTRTVVINTWYSPPSEVEAAQALIAAKADVLEGPLSDTAVMTVASAHNVWVEAGNGRNEESAAPAHYLGGTSYNWVPYLTTTLQDILAGTWKGGSNYLIPPGQGSNLGPLGAHVSSSAKSAVKAEYSAIKKGADPFTGPIYTQAKKLAIVSGKSLTANFVFQKWTWLVKGVIGQ